MKKYIYAAILAVVAAFTASAQDNKDYYLLVNTNDGNTVEFAFDYYPVATFEGDEMVITDEQHAESIRYDMGDIANLQITGKSNAVDNIADGQLLKVSVTKQNVSISGLEEGAAVNIHDMSGKLVASATAGSDGAVVIAVDGLGSGVFVASMPGNTFKFIR